MASVEIEIDDYLDEASTDGLSRELLDRYKAGKSIPENVQALILPDSDRLDAALAYWRRGAVEDALFNLEIVLGHNWDGLSDILRRRAA